MRALRARVGFATGVRPLPSRPAAILFALAVGVRTRSDSDAGYAAPCRRGHDGQLRAALAPDRRTLQVAAPTASAGGIGSAGSRLLDDPSLALVVNNALGAIHARDGRPLATPAGGPPSSPFGNTTLVVVATDAPLDRSSCRKLAELGHDALAIGIRPSHTMFDGDVVFTLSTGMASPMAPEAFLALGAAAVDAIGEAIERSVGDDV